MKRTLTVTQDYMLIPVRAEAETRTVSFWDGAKKLYEFAIPVGEGEGLYAFHYYAHLPMKGRKGHQITVEGDVPARFLEAIAQSDSVLRYAHKRPSVHFTPDAGWMNDPNGLVYQDGVYHLFFQHNPFDTRWENMSWGHAVSRDLLHWEQKDTVLFPDEDGTIYSGSGILNEQGMLGLPKDAAIFFYTSAGHNSPWSREKKFVQKIAYSLDGGATLTKKEGYVVPHIASDNRDPKVYWYAERQLYYMALYLEDNDYAIFNSTDLEHWEMTQRLTLPRASECPDLRQIPVEGGGSKWMFWSADGYYFLGDFDGSHFTIEGGLHEAYQTLLPYAAQTYWGTDRVIIIPWLRSDNQGKLYTGAMGIPRQLTLAKQGEDYVLRQKPVEELARCRQLAVKERLCASAKDSLSYDQGCEAAVEVALQLEESAGFTVDLYGTVCTYEKEKGRIKIAAVASRGNCVENAARVHEKEGVCAQEAECRYLTVGEDLREISFLSDGEILEITAQDGLIADVYETALDEKSGAICVETKGAADVGIFTVK